MRDQMACVIFKNIHYIIAEMMQYGLFAMFFNTLYAWDKKKT